MPRCEDEVLVHFSISIGGTRSLGYLCAIHSHYSYMLATPTSTSSDAKACFGLPTELALLLLLTLNGQSVSLWTPYHPHSRTKIPLVRFTITITKALIATLSWQLADSRSEHRDVQDSRRCTMTVLRRMPRATCARAFLRTRMGNHTVTCAISRGHHSILQ